jgi:hypothetical protein
MIYISRGAVTFGELFIDDVFVWGPALITAYKLESSFALYPRVIVDDSIIRIANSLILENCPKSNLEINNLKEDFDGFYFFDYLNYPRDPNTKNTITKALFNVEQKIKGESDKRILQKMYWHKNYLLSCEEKWE